MWGHGAGDGGIGGFLVPGEVVAVSPGSKGHGGRAGGQGCCRRKVSLLPCSPSRSWVEGWEAAASAAAAGPWMRTMAEISLEVGVQLGPALAGHYQGAFWRWAALLLQGLRFQSVFPFTVGMKSLFFFFC